MKFFTRLLILAMCTGSVCAQSPGGVSSPELWLRTVPVSTNLSGSYRWQDFSGDSLRLHIYDERGAAFGEEYTTGTIRSYNGHPAIDLTKLLDTKTREVQLKRTSLSQATIIGVFAPSLNFDSETLLYGLNGRPGQGTWVGTDKIYPSNQSGKPVFDYGQTQGMDLRYSSNDSEPNVNKFREQSMRIAAYYRSVPPSTGLWGERDKAVFTFGTYKPANVNNTSTFTIPGGVNRQFTGFIPEFIAYNRLLAPLERRQVDSYLAIKYGLSLPVSLIGSSGQLLWDYAANPAYNNRVTGIYRDNASGLYQTESATSYEEGPSYTDSNDFYHNSSPNNRSSSSRLLVAGRQYANIIRDGGYLFWGDDNNSIKLHSIEGMLGLNKMQRTWKVITNIPESTPEERRLDWQVQDLQLTTRGYVNTFVKSAAGNSPEQGIAFTKIPLKDYSGYLGLTNMSSLSGNLYLKFGTNTAPATPGSHDYGYFISGLNVYPIIRGAVSGTSVATLILASRLEVEKQGDEVFLRVGGSRITQSLIEIDPSDREKDFYGAIAMTKGLLEGSVDLRHGGFTDTGNKVELSYAAGKASEFKDNTKGTGLLLIDRTGEGNFDLNSVDIIEALETDAVRQKVIFNNVFFNTGDVFTFAYRESNLSGEVEVVDPSCNQTDGQITVRLSSGIRAFDYTLTDIATQQVVRTGKEYSYTIHIGGLAPGEYELKIAEAGGFNFDNGDGVSTRAKTTNFLPVFDGSLSWTVSSLTDTYLVGYTTILEDVSSTKNIIHYGLKKDGNKLYQIINKKVSTTVMTTVAVGDIIEVSKSMTGIKYYKNGTQIGSGSISLLDYLVKFYGLIDMSSGKAELLNVAASGFFDLADYNWTGAGNMNVTKSNDAALSYTFILEDPCGTGFVQPAPEAPKTRAEDRFRVSYVQGSMRVKAEIEFEEPDVVSFTVFNMNGQLVQKKNLTTPQRIQMADLSVPVSGIYIIKAITTRGEYTKKLLIQ